MVKIVTKTEAVAGVDVEVDGKLIKVWGWESGEVGAYLPLFTVNQARELAAALLSAALAVEADDV